MTQNNKKYYTVAALTLLILMAVTYTLSKLSMPKVTLPLGQFIVTDGLIEARTTGTHDWVIVSEGDKAFTGIEIRVGNNASATIHDERHQITVSPDSNITTKGLPGLIELGVERGELKIETASTDVAYAVMTDFGQVELSSNTTLTVTRPAGKPYAVVIVQKGEAKLNYKDARRRNKSSTKLTSDMPPKVISTSTQHALWLTSPGPEDIIPGNEGFAALALKWSGNEPHGNVLLRNLSSGEMITHESVPSDFEVTLPAGSYSWVVNSDGAVTTPRRFHITGQRAEADALTTQPAQIAEAQPAVPTPITPSSTQAAPKPAKAETAKAPEQTSEPAKTPAAGAEASKSEAQKDETPAEREAPAVKLLEPKKGTQIPVSAIGEKRIAWIVKSPANTLEIEVLGSSGNPSLRFILEGTRSRQKLTTLPPGRYAVRLRGIAGSGDKALAGEWAESFFDVIQTEAGQMAPTEVKASLYTKEKPSKLLIQWKKSPAPQYQVRVISAGEPATILRSKKSKVILPAPKSGTATVSLCALDANLHIRGCAPDVNVP